jgi:HSP20 family protein
MALMQNRSNGLTPWSSDMTPSPSSPWSLLDRLMQDFAGPNPSGARFPLDLLETHEHVILDIALPGVNPEDLDVQVEGRTLFIRGRYAPVSGDGQRYWVKGLPSGDFQFSVALPVKVETDAVNASLNAGLLHLELPKIAEARTKKIEIKPVSSHPIKTIG